MLSASPVFRLTLLALIAIATLFPPFSWGDALLQSDTERRIARYRFPDTFEQLPLKSYDFLLSDSIRELTEWGRDGSKSVPKPVVLHRRLLFAELLLEYLGSLAVAVMAGLVHQTWSRPQRKRPAA